MDLHLISQIQEDTNMIPELYRKTLEDFNKNQMPILDYNNNLEFNMTQGDLRDKKKYFLLNKINRELKVFKYNKVNNKIQELDNLNI